MCPFFARGRRGRRITRRNLVWIAPLALAGGAAAFVIIGSVVTWLWKVTLSDIFAIKAISFWQAWGLIVLAQIFFKANAQPTMRTRRRRRWGRRQHRGAESLESPPTGI